jgi:3-phenylpropionate/trans-cinnamate dioxygenase ferredoxin reductase component
VPFDGLVIATGASPRRPACPHGLDGVLFLRTLDDCLALRAALTHGTPRVVVVGAGFIGCEVASTCRSLGLDATVVDPLPSVLAALGPSLGALCADVQREHGVGLRLGRALTGFEGSERLERVRLDDGSAIEADVAVVGIGVRPATGWLEGSGLVLQDGAVCDETSAALGCDRVVAAGDIARWPNALFGGHLSRAEHWSNAVEQGAAAAATLLAEPGRALPYAPVPSFWTDQFGIKIQRVGHPLLADSSELVKGSFEERHFVLTYRKLTV